MTPGTSIVGWFMFSLMSIMLVSWLAYLARLRKRGEPLPRGHGFQTTTSVFVLLGTLQMALRYRPEWFSWTLFAAQILLGVYMARYLWGRFRALRERAHQEREAIMSSTSGDKP